jgi:hypothetical protein
MNIYLYERKKQNNKKPKARTVLLNLIEVDKYISPSQIAVDIFDAPPPNVKPVEMIKTSYFSNNVA